VSDDKKDDKKDQSKKDEKKPPVMKMARTTSSESTDDQSSIYDTMQIKTLAIQNNPVAQAVTDMLGKTADPEVRNTIKKAATDVMKPELGTPEELNKKLEADKCSDKTKSDAESK